MCGIHRGGRRHAGRIGVGLRNGVLRLPDIGVLVRRRGVFVVPYQCMDEMLDLSRVVAFCIRLELNARDRLIPIAHDRRGVYGSGLNLGACEQLGVGADAINCGTPPASMLPGVPKRASSV